MNEFYVYAHYRESDGRIFYIGKGCGNRAFSEKGRNPHWKNVAKKHGWTSKIMATFSSEKCAFTYEKILISLLGLDNLTNKTNGGEGKSGYKLTPCQRLLLSSSRLGLKKTPEHIEKIRLWHTGRKRSKETGKIISDKAKERFSDPRNHWHTKEIINVWWHEEMGIKTATHLEMSEFFGLDISMLKKVESGSLFSFKGWKVAGVRNYSEKHGPKSNTFDSQVFVWTKDGEDSFVGTRWDFTNAKGVIDKSTYAVGSGKTKTFMGWKVKKL